MTIISGIEYRISQRGLCGEHALEMKLQGEWVDIAIMATSKACESALYKIFKKAEKEKRNSIEVQEGK